MCVLENSQQIYIILLFYYFIIILHNNIYKMVKSIIITSANYTSGSSFKYSFRSPLKIPDDISHISVVSCAVYNNTFNITSSYGNNTLTINWLGTNYTLTFPNGYYSASDINSYIQAYCYSNNLYMTTSNGSIVYFIECTTNSVRYAISLNLYYIPTSANATTLGYTMPSGASWSAPATNQTPTITFNSAFGSLIGLSAGTYPATAQTTNVQYVSTTTPIISPVNCYVITMSLLSNPYSYPNNVLYTIPLNASFGSLVTSTPANLVWNDLCGGNYNEFTITLYDQNMNQLSLNDNEVVITLALGKLKNGVVE
jgi:hypothetical protein